MHQCPIVVVEWGWFDRVNKKQDSYTKHWQLAIGGLNQIPPPGDYPDDRFKATGLQIEDRPPKPDGYVLVCGQLPFDAAVGGGYKSWLLGRMQELEAAGETVLYRPHPQDKRMEVKWHTHHNGPLSEGLNEAKYAVCYNSNVGHEALLMGVPVVCDPVAPYHELSGTECPSQADRLAYFSRAAYGQWKFDEFAEGFRVTMERLCKTTS